MQTSTTATTTVIFPENESESVNVSNANFFNIWNTVYIPTKGYYFGVVETSPSFIENIPSSIQLVNLNKKNVTIDS